MNVNLKITLTITIHITITMNITSTIHTLALTCAHRKPLFFDHKREQRAALNSITRKHIEAKKGTTISSQHRAQHNHLAVPNHSAVQTELLSQTSRSQMWRITCDKRERSAQGAQTEIRIVDLYADVHTHSSDLTGSALFQATSIIFTEDTSATQTRSVPRQTRP